MTFIYKEQFLVKQNLVLWASKKI